MGGNVKTLSPCYLRYYFVVHDMITAQQSLYKAQGKEMLLWNTCMGLSRRRPQYHR